MGTAPSRQTRTAQFAAPAERYDRFMGRYTRTLAPALADADNAFLQGATTNKLDYQWFADGFGSELRVEILKSGDRLPAEDNENIANHNARFVCGTIGFHLEHDCGGCFAAL